MPSLPSLRSLRISPAPTLDEVCRVFATQVQAICDSLRALLSNPRARSTTLLGVTITAAGVTLNHGLNLPAGVEPSGWAVTDNATLATFARTAWTNTSITLVSSVTTVATVEVW